MFFTDNSFKDVLADKSKEVSGVLYILNFSKNVLADKSREFRGVLLNSNSFKDVLADKSRNVKDVDPISKCSNVVLTDIFDSGASITDKNLNEVADTSRDDIDVLRIVILVDAVVSGKKLMEVNNGLSYICKSSRYSLVTMVSVSLHSRNTTSLKHGKY